jgi:uncharacterized protein with FMN-binding domain
MGRCTNTASSTHLISRSFTTFACQIELRVLTSKSNSGHRTDAVQHEPTLTTSADTVYTGYEDTTSHPHELGLDPDQQQIRMSN